MQKTDLFETFVIHRKDWVRAEFKDVNLEECSYRKGVVIHKKALRCSKLVSTP